MGLKKLVEQERIEAEMRMEMEAEQEAASKATTLAQQTRDEGR